jgi:lysyl-tRNA synthetase, class II
MRPSLTSRRAAVLWTGVAVAVGSFVLEGFWLTAAAVGLSAMISALAAGLKWHRHREPREPTHSRLGPAVLPIAGISWGLAAAADLAVPAARAIRVARALHPLRGVPALVLIHSRVSDPWTTVIDVILAGALVSLLLAARSLRRPGWLEPEHSQAAFEHARAIVEDHGEDSLSPFILRPDKSFEFSAGAVAAYRVVGDTVVVSGDPVGPDGSDREVLAQLLERAHGAGLRVAVYGGSERHLETYRSLGLRASCVGEEAVVDPMKFTLEGRAVRKLRQSVNRVERRGWRIEVWEGRDIDGRLEAGIDAVEAAWRSQRERLLGFAMSMGEYELGVRPRDVYALAWAPDGELHAVMRFLAHRGKLSLDTMRRVGETPNGLNEALVCHVLQFAREHAVAEVSLNYAGLGHLVRRGPSGNRVGRALTQFGLSRLRKSFQMDRLVLFNEKFFPSWRPRYLVYESRGALARSAFRVLQAEGYLPGPGVRPDSKAEPWLRPGSSPSLKERLGG